VRTVHDMRFSETSIVGFPAYPATSIGVEASSASRNIDWLMLQQRAKLAR
jgi:phage head maturation protease